MKRSPLRSARKCPTPTNTVPAALSPHPFTSPRTASRPNNMTSSKDHRSPSARHRSPSASSTVASSRYHPGSNKMGGTNASLNNGAAHQAPSHLLHLHHHHRALTLKDARKETHKELQRHLQSLLHIKQKLRRVHDDLGKEYSSVSKAIENSGMLLEEWDVVLEQNNQLIAQSEVTNTQTSILEQLTSGTKSIPPAQSSTFQNIVNNFNNNTFYSNHGAAATTMQPVDHHHYLHQHQIASSNQDLQQSGQQEQDGKPGGRSVSVSSHIAADIERHKRHFEILHRHYELLLKMVDEAKQLLKEIPTADQEIQHLMTLIDRASDIDLQCLDESMRDTIITNGSPLFPNRTIDDADAVMQRCSALCSKAGRFSTLMRRLISTGKAEASSSAHHLTVAMQTSARVAAEQVATVRRQLEGIQWEEARLYRLLSDIEAETSKTVKRLSIVERTLGLRAAARESIFSKGGVDPVAEMMEMEKTDLLARQEELASKAEYHQQQLTKLHSEREVMELAVTEAANRTEGCIKIAVESSQNASRNQTPLRHHSPGPGLAGSTPRRR